jgi:excisionase family DNA binding protein
MGAIMEKLLRIKEAAELLSLTPRAVYELTITKKLTYVSVGEKGKRIPESEIEEFIRRNTVKATR